MVVTREFSSCSLKALEGLDVGAQAWLVSGMWNLPRPGVNLVSPELGGEFLSTVPQESPSILKRGTE